MTERGVCATWRKKTRPPPQKTRMVPRIESEKEVEEEKLTPSRRQMAETNPRAQRGGASKQKTKKTKSITDRSTARSCGFVWLFVLSFSFLLVVVLAALLLSRRLDSAIWVPVAGFGRSCPHLFFVLFWFFTARAGFFRLFDALHDKYEIGQELAQGKRKAHGCALSALAATLITVPPALMLFRLSPSPPLFHPTAAAAADTSSNIF